MPLLAHSDDKPTIGLLLCKSKNALMAEYALRSFSAPIGHSLHFDRTDFGSRTPVLASSLCTIRDPGRHLRVLGENHCPTVIHIARRGPKDGDGVREN